MPHTTLVTVPCPHLMDDGFPCDADVDVEIAYSPEEQGTRWEPGAPAYYYVLDVAPVCGEGHRFTKDDWRVLNTRAEHAAADYRPED